MARPGGGLADDVGALLVGAHPVGGAVDADDDAAVQQPVEGGGGEHRVASRSAQDAIPTWLVVMTLPRRPSQRRDISGPAARRMAAAAASRFAGVPVTLAAARKLLKNGDAMIYDNPRALVICHYKRDKALCHRDTAPGTLPADRCVPGCGNIVRTDAPAARLRATLAGLKKTLAAKNRELAQLRVDVPALVRAVNQLTLEIHELRSMRDAAGTVVPFPGRAPARPGD